MLSVSHQFAAILFLSALLPSRSGLPTFWRPSPGVGASVFLINRELFFSSLLQNNQSSALSIAIILFSLLVGSKEAEKAIRVSIVLSLIWVRAWGQSFCTLAASRPLIIQRGSCYFKDARLHLLWSASLSKETSIAAIFILLVLILCLSLSEILLLHCLSLSSPVSSRSYLGLDKLSSSSSNLHVIRSWNSRSPDLHTSDIRQTVLLPSAAISLTTKSWVSCAFFFRSSSTAVSN